MSTQPCPPKRGGGRRWGRKDEWCQKDLGGRKHAPAVKSRQQADYRFFTTCITLQKVTRVLEDNIYLGHFSGLLVHSNSEKRDSWCNQMP